jgi:hypothetical protein
MRRLGGGICIALLHLGFAQLINSPATPSSSYFGSAIAFSSDGTILVVGASGGAASVGYVHVYVCVGSCSTFALSVRDPRNVVTGLFGFAVASSGTGATVAVGAPGSKSAYILRCDSVAISCTVVWSYAFTGLNLNYGISIALSADGALLAVGAPSMDHTVSGYIFVYRCTGAGCGSPPQQLAAPPSCNRHSFVFGGSVALSSDATVLAVGDQGSGAVYRYSCNTTACVLSSDALENPGACSATGNCSSFGNAVAVSSTGSTIAVGTCGSSFATNGLFSFSCGSGGCGGPAANVMSSPVSSSFISVECDFAMSSDGSKFAFLAYNSSGSNSAFWAHYADQATCTGPSCTPQMFFISESSATVSSGGVSQLSGVGASVAMSGDGLKVAVGLPLTNVVRVFVVNATRSQSATRSRSQTVTQSRSQSATRSRSQASTKTQTQTATGSQSQSPTPSLSLGTSPSQSDSMTPTQSGTVSQRTTESMTATGTPTQSRTPSSSPSQSVTSTASASTTATPSQSATASGTQTLSTTTSPTQSSSSSQSSTASGTATSSETVTGSQSSSASSTLTPSGSPSPTLTISPSSSGTPSNSETPTLTGSPSQSLTPSATVSGTLTQSRSQTLSRSPSQSATQSATETTSQAQTRSPTLTASGTSSQSASETPSQSQSTTQTQSFTASSTQSSSQTQTPSQSGSPSETQSSSQSQSQSVTPTQTASVSRSPTQSPTPTTSLRPFMLRVGNLSEESPAIVLSDSLPPVALALEINRCPEVGLSSFSVHCFTASVALDADETSAFSAFSVTTTGESVVSLACDPSSPLPVDIPSSVLLGASFRSGGGVSTFACELMAGPNSIARQVIAADIEPTLWPIWEDAILVSAAAGLSRSASLGLTLNATPALLAACGSFDGSVEPLATVSRFYAECLLTGITVRVCPPPACFHRVRGLTIISCALSCRISGAGSPYPSKHRHLL